MTPHRLSTRLVSSTAVALLVIGSAATAASAGAVPEPTASASMSASPTIPGQIAVTWTPGSTSAERAAVRSRHGLSTEERFGEVDIEVVHVPDSDAPGIAAALRGEPAVELAEVDRLVAGATNDPWFPQQWPLHNTGQGGGTADVDVDAPEAWATTRGSAQVIVAVLDTGIDTSHPDLAPNIWRNPGETPGNGVDDDRNGYVDDVHGWDFVANDATVYDSPTHDLHGTHVAGTIAAWPATGSASPAWHRTCGSCR